MPRKRTHAKRWNRHAEYDAWESVFDCGTDFFGDLPRIGVATDQYGEPDRDMARAAWQRHGLAYLQTHERTTPAGETLWALQQFGEPIRAD